MKPMNIGLTGTVPWPDVRPFWDCNRAGAVAKLRVVGRANQFNSGGGIYHMTHRCHNRAFLLQWSAVE